MSRPDAHAWLGQIPSGWRIVAFRHIFSESSETNGSRPVGKMLSISGYRGVEEKQYESESLIRDDSQVENYRVVRPGQLAVNTMWLNHGGLGVSDLLGHVSPAYRAYWISPSMDRRYAHHLLRCARYIDGYTARLSGIRPNSLQMSRADLMSFPILVPPENTQRAIADYLDRATAQIDAFIAKNEELIALLGERRRAIVSRAVFGEDVSGPRQDTRCEWIGTIPSNWAFSRLSRWFEVQLGKMLDEATFATTDGELLPYIRAANLKEAGLDVSHVNEMPFTRLEVSRFSLRRNDLLVVEGGSIGVNVTLEEDLPGWGFQKTVNRVRARGSESTRYLGLVLDVLRARGVLDMFTNVSTIQHLTAEKLERLLIPMPPSEDQHTIVACLQTRLAGIDAATSSALRATNLARERRSALISAAVTGQIDVGVA